MSKLELQAASMLCFLTKLEGWSSGAFCWDNIRDVVNCFDTV